MKTMKKAIIRTGAVTGFFLCGLAGTALGGEYSDTLNASMEELTSVARGAGQEGEQEQIQKLSERLKGYGYEVSLDEFTAQTVLKENFTSQNIVAKRKADQDKNQENGTADILVVSAHIDSIASTVGADDDASGVAVLESVAAAVQELPSNTEVWFVVFSGEEEGLKGSTHFAETITEDEKSRMIGDLQLDMLGHYLTEGYGVNTVNGRENLLAELLVDSVEEVTGKTISITQEKASDHVSFSVQGISSVMLNQKGDGFENHTIIDNLSQIDMDKLEEAAQIAGSVVKSVMSDETAGLAGEVQEKYLGDNLAGCLNPYSEIMDLDTSVQGMKNNMGTGLEKIDETEDEMLGTVTTYQGRMYWFGMETPLTTDFIFYNDYFQVGKIHAYEAGYTAEEIVQIITELAGEPQQGTTDDGQDSLFWGWLPGRTGYQMDWQEDGSYVLNVSSYTLGNKELSDILLDADGEPAGQLDASVQKIWDDIISRVVPQEERIKYMDRFVLFTDGISVITGFTSPAEPDNTSNTMWLDLNDLLDENGEYRHYYKSVATVIHEFGHVIGMNRDQLDVAANGDDSYSLPPYWEASYMAAFMTDFYPDQEMDDRHAGENHIFLEHPDEYVSFYASDKTMEDFAESFKCFVMMNEQEGTSIAQQKVNFFYQYPELVSIREWIRGNFEWLN
ncbi:MAG: M28 family peptidase [Lachnospiraceae bacterium]|nr:M28 family peptidase [Lachnospiraceae bacterium]